MPQTIADYLRRVAAERMELAKKGLAPKVFNTAVGAITIRTFPIKRKMFDHLQALSRSARPEPEAPEPDTELDELAQEKYLLARGSEYWPHWKKMDRNNPVNAKRRQEAYEAAKKELARLEEQRKAADKIKAHDMVKVARENGPRWEYIKRRFPFSALATSLNEFDAEGWRPIKFIEENDTPEPSQWVIFRRML